LNLKRTERRIIMSERNKALCACVTIAVLCLFLPACGQEAPGFKTEYQAVFMDNGQVFFGKLSHAGAAYPLLNDVHYIGRQASPDGKVVKNILVKRGNEWHGPEYMYINKQHIVVIEPVSASSRVAQLIKETKTQQPQPQATQPPSEGEAGK
jgi:hypothetical protein